jgi:hypothetical protein
MINIIKMVAFTVGENLVKKAIIEIILIPEASKELAKEIEQEILAELREGFLRIPWSYEIGRVKVIDI